MFVSVLAVIVDIRDHVPPATTGNVHQNSTKHSVV